MDINQLASKITKETTKEKKVKAKKKKTEKQK